MRIATLETEVEALRKENRALQVERDAMRMQDSQETFSGERRLSANVHQPIVRSSSKRPSEGAELAYEMGLVDGQRNLPGSEIAAAKVNMALSIACERLRTALASAASARGIDPTDLEAVADAAVAAVMSAMDSVDQPSSRALPPLPHTHTHIYTMLVISRSSKCALFHTIVAAMLPSLCPKHFLPPHTMHTD
jgi:hypothetical protein